MSGCRDCDAAGHATCTPAAPAPAKPRVVAIVGPPNSGKSTLFNRLTGLRQKVANFPGVTVEQHTGEMTLDGGREISLIDLPGIYSLNPHSEDEQIGRAHV